MSNTMAGNNMNYALLIYPALLLLIIFYKAQPYHARNTENSLRKTVQEQKDLFLSLDQAKMIQGAACIGVILHHLTQQITSYGTFYKGPITIFNYMGILFTALFFFFSGYGLITSFYTKPDYLHHFLQKRLSSILIPFWIINALGVVLSLTVYGAHYTPREIAGYISGVMLLNGNSWFIVEITFLYLFFYIFFRLIRRKDIALLLLCAASAALIFYSFHQGHDLPGAPIHWFKGEWWYNSTAAFIFGLLYARFGRKITSFCRRHYIPFIAICAVLALGTFQISVYCLLRFGYYRTGDASSVRYSMHVTLASQIIACLAFTMFVTGLNMKIFIGNRILKFLGRISRDLFLIHGYFISRVFSGIRMNDFLRFAAVLSCSIACTAVISPAIKWLQKHVQRLIAPPSKSSKIPETEQGRKDFQNNTQHPHPQKSRKKAVRILLALTVLSLAGFLSAAVLLSLRTKKEFESESVMLRTAKVNDHVLWGRYETDPSTFGKERLSWIVLAKDNNRICLLTEEGIAGNSYHRKHEAVSWEHCDLRRLLNSDSFLDTFSKYERNCLVTTDGDLVSLLTVKQAKKYFSDDEDRTISITQAAMQKGTNADRLSHRKVWYDKKYSYSWWWLRGESGEQAVTAPIVDLDGTICPDTKAVNKPSGAIRPVIWVQI